jgi:hypothetical protein
MDFVNWVVSRVDEVMAQNDLNRADDSRDIIPRRVPERSAATGAVESPDKPDASPRSAA